MADEYISREAVMDAFAKRVKRSNNSDFAPAPTWNQAVQIVEDIPAADVAEVRHGHWNHEHLASTTGGTYSVIRCSECGWAYPIFTTAFCPNCGARMDESEDEEPFANDINVGDKDESEDNK